MLEVFEEVLEMAVEYLVPTLELIGLLVLVIGAVKSLIMYIKGKFDADKAEIKVNLLESFALALQFMMGAEILKTIICKSLLDIAIVGALVVVRTALAVVSHWEVTNEKKHLEGHGHEHAE